MNNYDEVQKRLARLCEEAHEAGIRHKGLSGSLCEDLLLCALRKDIPGVLFNRGMIKFEAPRIVGSQLHKKDLSGQLDIIIYKRKPLKKIANYVVVHKKNAVGAIEVKKWLDPKSLRETLRKIDESKIKMGKSFPFFLVTFRFKDRKVPQKWGDEVARLRARLCYCFFGTYGKKNRRNLYPWEEKEWRSFEKCGYAGQYKKLVNDIRNLVVIRHLA